MEINYSDERILKILEIAEAKRLAQKQCLDKIDLNELKKDNIYLAKFNYDKCVSSSGFPKNNSTNKSIYNY